MTSITEVRWQREGRSVDFEDGVFTVNEVLEVWTDLPADPGASVTSDPLFFVGDPLFPEIGDVHPENNNLRFTTIGQGTMLEGDKSKWQFPLVYSSNQTAIADQGGNSNFEDDEFVDASIARKSWSFKSIKVPRRASPVSDDGGTSYTTNSYFPGTTAGEPINVTETAYLPVLSYTRNELATPSSVLTFVGSVNSDAITLDGLSVAPDAALCSDVKISEWKRDQAVQFRTVQYQFILKDSLWDLELINRGFYVRESTDPKPSHAELPAGPSGKKTPVTTPQLLGFTQGTGATDKDKFLSSETFLLDASATVDPSDVHVRQYKHPQRAAFAGYGFS
jgi:hypothetical protein